MNRVNLKAGIALPVPHEYDPQLPHHYYGKFHYADVEYGLEGAKLSVGVGQYIGHGADRFGLSYARLEAQDLAGLEAVIG